jgi:hypothetical protein
MTKSQYLVWEVYFLILALFIAAKVLSFFDPASDIYFYFKTLQAFDMYFLVAYTFNLLQVLFSLMMLVPLLLYIYRRRLGPASLWQVYFTLLLALDALGHPYEMQFIRAAYMDWPVHGIMEFIYQYMIYLPAYLAVFIYAFRQESLTLEEI